MLKHEYTDYVTSFKIDMENYKTPQVIITKKARSPINIDIGHPNKEMDKLIKQQCFKGKHIPTFEGYGICIGKDGKPKEIDYREQKIVNIDPTLAKEEFIEKHIGIRNTPVDIYDRNDPRRNRFINKVDLDKIFGRK